jgi:hypothetical protein
MDYAITFLAPLVSLVVGFIWYNTNVFGKAWMSSAGLTEEQLKGGNMLKIFGLTYLLSLMFTIFLMAVVIHQAHIKSIFANTPGADDPATPVGAMLKDFMAKYGQNFRTFKHGVFHGVIAAIFFAMPIIGINAIFERRSFKYVMIHTGYWAITFAIIGGILCQWIKLG